MKFFTYTQNNSGGSFDFDREGGITYHVIIEATNPAHANERAQEIGLYFKGVDEGRDCDCCGDRWSSMQSYDKGYDEPTVYGAVVLREPVVNLPWCDPNTIIHYLDGTIVAVPNAEE